MRYTHARLLRAFPARLLRAFCAPARAPSSSITRPRAPSAPAFHASPRACPRLLFGRAPLSARVQRARLPRAPSSTVSCPRLRARVQRARLPRARARPRQIRLTPTSRRAMIAPCPLTLRAGTAPPGARATAPGRVSVFCLSAAGGVFAPSPDTIPVRTC